MITEKLACTGFKEAEKRRRTMTDIYIVSGFLGAGKTTLIQKLLKEGFQGKKAALIENDFGDISVDAALLRDGNVQVKEMNAGCICCSLSGDFVKAMKDLLDQFHPDIILIEPSGVGKLSDITKFCANPQIRSLAQIKQKITVADVKRCAIYLENFGEFFEDQIINADTILLSWAEDYPGKVKSAFQLVSRLNPDAKILSEPWMKINTARLLNLYQNDQSMISEKDYLDKGHCIDNPELKRQLKPLYCDNHTEQDEGQDSCDCGHTQQNSDLVSCGCSCSCSHTQNSDHVSGSCVSSHSAEEVFDTVTIHPAKVFNTTDLQRRLWQMERNTSGTVLRAKGIVHTAGGYLNVQYVPGSVQMKECSSSGDMLCIIGRGLKQDELAFLFDGN